MTLIDACNDPKLFAAWFRDHNTWATWFAFIAALFALPMTPDQLALYRQCTGRKAAPPSPMTEGWLICGRRAGKSFVLGLIAVFLACFRDWRPFLAPGERGTVMVIATDRRQARTIVRYIRGLLTGVPFLAQMIEREASDSFDLSNGITIEIATANFRSVRGYTIVAALCDEMAFWPTEDAAAPDYEIINALKPGMATVPNAVLLCASSPYAKRGALWDAFKNYHGKDDPSVLVWKAATRVMNPTVPQSVIDRAMERDPDSASAEYGAVFRQDISGYMTRDAIEAVVTPGCIERPYETGKLYSAFVDPSGGSRNSFTLAIGHMDKKTDVAVLDVLRDRRPPFSPEAVIQDFADTLKKYNITKVKGDRYAGEFPRELFRKRGITYELADLPKSDLYRSFLPAVNSKRVDLLDSPILINQLTGLERRTSGGGRDLIDHAPSSHDDTANVCSGVLHYAAARDQAPPEAQFGRYEFA